MARLERPQLLVAVVVVVLLALGIDAGRRFSTDTSMEHFLPGQGERKLYRVSRQVIDSTLTGRMVITVGLRSAELNRSERRARLLEASATLEKAIGALPGFTDITGGPPAGLEESFFELYFPRRFAFFSLQPENDAAQRFSDATLREDAKRLKNKLAGPQGVFIRQLAARDPWLLFPQLLDGADQSAIRLDIHEGRFFASPRSAPSEALDANEDFAILFAELKDSALDSSAQSPVLAGLDAAIHSMRAKHGAEFFVESSGANRFAVATERSMKSDIERVFSLSTLGLLALFLAFFRSLARVLFLVLPIMAGLVGALWVSLLVLGQVHALTLAFGGALIGVAIDYPVHVLSHHELGQSGDTPQQSVRRLRATLGLAAGTTIVGLVGLAWASFPGIQEIALFSSVGVSCALLTTALISGLLPPSGQAPRTSTRLSALLEQLLQALRSRPLFAWLLLGVALILGAAGLTTVRFAPGLDSLAPLDKQLLAEDERVGARVGNVDGGKLAIALAPDEEQALRINEEVALALESAKSEGALSEYTSLTTLLRSRELQKRAHRAATTSPRLKERTLFALQEEGFVRDGFAELDEALALSPEPLTYKQLAASPLAPLVAPFVFEVGEDTAVITPLAGLKDEEALSRTINEIPGAHFFSQRTLLNQAYSDLRARTTELLLVGLLLVFVAAWARYRNTRRALAATLPSVLAAGATVGVLSLVGVELNLLHLLGLLLVCSMGVDYGVFLVDAPRGHVGPALLSISIGCTSTMLSFGALALSSAPALQALGSSIGIGIVLSLLLAPTAFLLLQPQERGAQ